MRGVGEEIRSDDGAPLVHGETHHPGAGRKHDVIERGSPIAGNRERGEIVQFGLPAVEDGRGRPEEHEDAIDDALADLPRVQ
jgi:hypothetical protein